MIEWKVYKSKRPNRNDYLCGQIGEILCFFIDKIKVDADVYELSCILPCSSGTIARFEIVDEAKCRAEVELQNWLKLAELSEKEKEQS